MLKVRVTFVDNEKGNDQLEEFIEMLNKTVSKAKTPKEE